MTELENVCAEILDDVEGALGCAVIDLEAGNPLAAATRRGSLSSESMGLICLAVSDLFHGKLIRQFRRAWSGDGATTEHFVREVQLATANSNQFMSTTPGHDHWGLALITDKTVSRGLGWMAVHEGLTRVAATLPEGMPVPGGGYSPQPIPTVDEATVESGPTTGAHSGSGRPPSQGEAKEPGGRETSLPPLPAESLGTDALSRVGSLDGTETTEEVGHVPRPREPTREENVRAGPRARMFVPKE